MSLFEKNKTSVVLILDIGNGSVGAAVVLLDGGAKPRIISFVRELILYDEKPTAHKLQSIVLQKITEILPDVITRGFINPHFKNHPLKFDSILCVLSSPWFVSKGKTITISQDKAFVVSQNFIQDILTKEVQKFEQEMSHVSGLRVVEQSVLGMRVEDTSVKNPMGKSTNHFEISIYMTLAEENFIKRISDSVLSQTNSDASTLIFHSFTLVAFSNIRDMFLHTQDYLHIDIAGEITDVSLVRNGMITNTTSFPVGKNTLIRAIAKQMKSSSETARATLHMALEKRAHATAESEIVTALEYAEKEWNEQLYRTLQSFISESKNESLPQQVFMTTYPQTAEIFSRFLKTEHPDELSSWRRKLVLTYIGLEMMSGFCSNTSHEEGDSFIALESLFLSKFV